MSQADAAQGATEGTTARERVKKPGTDLPPPAFFNVVLLNDDYTPMDFVVRILQKCFFKSAKEAHDLMLEVHQKGNAVCGTYTYEVAEAKIAHVMELARAAQHPLQCALEKA